MTFSHPLDIWINLLTAIDRDTIVDGLLYKSVDIGAGIFDGFDVFFPAVEQPQKPKVEAYASHVLGEAEGLRKRDTRRRFISGLGVSRLSEQKLGSGVKCLRVRSVVYFGGISSMATYSIEKQRE